MWFSKDVQNNCNKTKKQCQGPYTAFHMTSEMWFLSSLSHSLFVIDLICDPALSCFSDQILNNTGGWHEVLMFTFSAAMSFLL